MPKQDPTYPALPADNPQRVLTVAQPDSKTAHHLGIVGDTYTITVTGDDTNEQFCVVDMHVPPGGGPGPHRHDFEETFIVLEGEVEATFRGQRSSVRAGTTINIPANAPHRFQNISEEPARLLCICSPAGQERFFQEIGVPLPTRTGAPPPLNEAQQAGFMEKAQALAPKYRTEFLKEA